MRRPVASGANVVKQSWHRDLTGLVDQTSQKHGQRGCGIRHRASPHSTVNGMVEGAHFHVDRDQPAQARRQRGNTRCQVGGIREHQNVCVEAIAMSPQKGGEMF